MKHRPQFTTILIATLIALVIWFWPTNMERIDTAQWISNNGHIPELDSMKLSEQLTIRRLNTRLILDSEITCYWRYKTMYLETQNQKYIRISHNYADMCNRDGALYFRQQDSIDHNKIY